MTVEELAKRCAKLIAEELGHWDVSVGDADYDGSRPLAFIGLGSDYHTERKEVVIHA